MHDMLQAWLESQLRTVDSRLVVLHPRFTPQKRLLASLLAEPGLLYIQASANSASGTSIEALYENALSAQHGGASDNLNLIVLDECDRFVDGEVVPFLQKLLSTTSARIILLTRELPTSLLQQRSLASQLQIVPLSPELMLMNFAQPMQTTLLEVQSLGAGHVYVNGVPIENWDGTLPRALFFYLVDRGMVTRSQIFETFWPKLSMREATNVFHVTKRKINEVLGFDLMTYSAGFYCVTSEVELRYDVSLFLQSMQDSAVADPEDAPGLLQQSLWLYRGSFLGGLGNEFDWVCERRDQLRQSYGDALAALGHWRSEQGAPEQALHLYGRAAAINPQREDLADHMMRLYRDRGEPENALKVYRRLEDELHRTLKIKPARWLQELARELNDKVKRK